MSVNFIYDQVECVLKILGKMHNNETITQSDWEDLFLSKGYQWLAKRDDDMYEKLKIKETNESDFKSFLLGEGQVSKYENFLRSHGISKSSDIESFILERPLKDYENFLRAYKLFKSIDIERIILDTKNYLPKDAKIETYIIPVIKPLNNSFVHTIENTLVLFLNLTPDISKEKLENTLIHELHHIGFANVHKPEKYKYLSEQAQMLIEWTTSFAEGFAMLAAARGPDNHPNKYYKIQKELWDVNIKRFNEDFSKIENFLLKILNEEFPDNEELYKEGFELMTNNGGQGSWYTVGWKVAVVIEKVEGKERLLECMSDLTKLYSTYNEAVITYNKKYNEELKSWSQKIIDALKM